MSQTHDVIDEADISRRVDALVAEMTPQEKAGQLTQLFSLGHMGGQNPMQQAVDDGVADGTVGACLFVTDPAEINRLQRLAVETTRLHIPLLFGFDVIHGMRTILPVPIGMAASWDPDLVERGQRVAAREARALGIHWTFAPNVDIARDPRWGRMVEGAGEDPCLGAAMAAAQVRGFQGGDVDEAIMAGPKHFVGYGAALGGRDYDEVNLSDHELHNVYLPPFQAAIDAGCGNVMTAYMPLNGVPATGNRWMFTDLLRETMGFDGFVVSDANAVKNLATHGFAADAADAGACALAAGVDMEMAFNDPAFATLAKGLDDGTVELAALDEAVRRVLAVKIRLGLFETPYVDEGRAAATLADTAHREVVRIAAEECAVLLKNDGGVLPLSAELGTIAVIGPLAASRRDILGPWCFAFDLDETVTVLDGIRARVGEDRVTYAPGIRPAKRTFPSLFDMFPGNVPEDPEGFDDATELERAVETARNADVAVVVIGEWQHMIGEMASRASLDLPGDQMALLRAVVETGTPVVAVVMNGRPLDLRWADEHVPAILDVWYPGTQGGTAVANLLFGDVSPAGRLPFTWPRSVGQIPMIHSATLSHDPDARGRRYWDEASTPLYPFGHGMSYTAFAYGEPTVSMDRIGVNDSVDVSVEVTNTGDRAADEVVQLYLHQRHGRAARPARELKAFRRVALEAGETRTVTFAIGPGKRRYWHALERDWVLDAATFDVWVGGSSAAEQRTTFTAVAS